MEDAGMYIYYLNTDDDALEKQEYENNSEKDGDCRERYALRST